MQDFKSMEEVYAHVDETLVVDLLKHALSLDEKYSAMLKDADKGLYLPGDFEPTFRQDKLYFRKAGMAMSTTGVPEIIAHEETSLAKKAIKGGVMDMSTNPPIALEGLSKIVDDIYDQDFNLIMSAKDMSKLGRHLKVDPTIPANAVRMAMGIIQSTVHTMCRHSTPGFHSHRPDRLVKPELDIDVYGEFENAFERLLVQVHNFIDCNHWNFYTYRLRGTTLIIQRGLDWRIAEYYRMKFEKEEALHLED